MKNFIVVIIVLLIFSSCTVSTINEYEKPWIIINKFIEIKETGDTVFTYYYQPYYGKEQRFQEFTEKYEVGDTIE